MAVRRNEFGQLVGDPVEGWSERPLPPRTPMVGRYCRLEPLDAGRHGDGLYSAYAEAPDGRDWTYLSAGPFHDVTQCRDYLRQEEGQRDLLYHAIIDILSGQAVGIAAFMRIDPFHGAVEVGNVAYSPRLQRSRAGTEAMFLLMRRIFDELGYRRYEWKCDSLNERSRRAAERYGFRYEGTFRQAMVRRGCNRDTAWFSVTDGEWPNLRRAFEQWLSPENFDNDSRQRRSLTELRELAR